MSPSGNRTHVAVIGGGPAGICAALAAADQGCEVILFEQNEKIGKKLYLTGKGRCNVTNGCDKEDFFAAIMRNPRFLYSAYAAFNQKDLMQLIENSGCPLKTERGNRVFPVSDKSSDIIKAFERLLNKAGVSVLLHARVSEMIISEQNDDKKVITGIRLSDEKVFEADQVILATGGMSYSSTGSDGYGLQLAQKCGHRIVPCRPSLVGLETEETWPKILQGLSLRNVALTLKKGQKKIWKEQGEMLFTHFGLSGPLVLTASAKMEGDPAGYRLHIDLKPALSEEQLNQRLLKDFEKYNKKHFENALGDLLPKSMIPVFVDLTGIASDKAVNQISKNERQRILSLLKNLTCRVSGFAPMETAIITAGGVDVRDINPKDMSSKIIEGLYFAGEMMDVDALTGGFNIQIAASTGWLAGCKCGNKKKEN